MRVRQPISLDGGSPVVKVQGKMGGIQGIPIPLEYRHPIQGTTIREVLFNSNVPPYLLLLLTNFII
jgi:hypothetical protein